MPASVKINRFTGADPGSKTDISSAINRASRADNASPGLANPIDTPDTGEGDFLSYWVITNLEITAPPDFSIFKIDWFTDGTNSFAANLGAGKITVRVATTSTYRAPEDSVLNTTNYPELDAAPVDAFGLTSGSPLSLLDVLPTSGDALKNVGDESKFLVYQIAVIDGAHVGLANPELFSWVYKEI